MSFALKKAQSSRGISSDLNKGGKKMKRCMITITTLLEDDTRQTVVLNIAKGDVSVNCPKSSGIEIKSFGSDSQFELLCKIPDSHEELHFQFKDPWMNASPDEFGCRAA